MTNNNIKLGRGFGDILFGITRTDLESILGPADFIDQFEDLESNNGQSQVLHYDNLDLSFTFEEQDDFRLSMISVNSDKYVLRDLIIVGMKKQKVLDLLEELNMPDFAEEDHSDADNPDYTLVTIDEKSLYLWFDNGHLTEIQWFPYYDEDENIIWPSK